MLNTVKNHYIYVTIELLAHRNASSVRSVGQDAFNSADNAADQENKKEHFLVARSRLSHLSCAATATIVMFDQGHATSRAANATAKLSLMATRVARLYSCVGRCGDRNCFPEQFAQS